MKSFTSYIQIQYFVPRSSSYIFYFRNAIAIKIILVYIV